MVPGFAIDSDHALTLGRVGIEVLGAGMRRSKGPDTVTEGKGRHRLLSVAADEHHRANMFYEIEKLRKPFRSGLKVGRCQPLSNRPKPRDDIPPKILHHPSGSSARVPHPNR